MIQTEAPIIALSLVPPQDLRRLGYLEQEFKQLTFELCLRLVRKGARISHGGHLREDSILVEVVDYLAGAFQSHAGSPRPLLHFFNQSDLASTPFRNLLDALVTMQAVTETWVPLVDGSSFKLAITEEIDPSSGDSAPFLSVLREGLPPETIPDEQAWQAFCSCLPAGTAKESVTRMREAQADAVSARICVGGKRGDQGVGEGADCYIGAYPGIYEEALLSLGAGQLFVVLGAYGGAARDVAVDLGFLADEGKVPYLGEPMQGTLEASMHVKELRDKIPAAWSPKLTDLAVRDDTESLAHDCIDWILNTLSERGGAPPSKSGDWDKWGNLDSIEESLTHGRLDRDS